MNLVHLLANPVVSVVLRVAFGIYIVLMARSFYADPLGYFRRTLRSLPDVPWLPQLVRICACFCLWGGCFIVATAITLQIFQLHGNALALGFGLILVSVIATWLLLPTSSASSQS
jgi:hypothetical protein